MSISRYDVAVTSGEIIRCSECGEDVYFKDAHPFEIDGKEIKLCFNCCPRCFAKDKIEVISIP